MNSFADSPFRILAPSNLWTENFREKSQVRTESTSLKWVQQWLNTFDYPKDVLLVYNGNKIMWSIWCIVILTLNYFLIIKSTTVKYEKQSNFRFFNLTTLTDWLHLIDHCRKISLYKLIFLNKPLVTPLTEPSTILRLRQLRNLLYIFKEPYLEGAKTVVWRNTLSQIKNFQWN